MQPNVATITADSHGPYDVRLVRSCPAAPSEPRSRSSGTGFQESDIEYSRMPDDLREVVNVTACLEPAPRRVLFGRRREAHYAATTILAEGEGRFASGQARSDTGCARTYAYEELRYRGRARALDAAEILLPKFVADVR